MKKAIKMLSLVGTCVASVAGCGEGTVSFESDVRPILAQHCLECHQEGGKGFEKSGLAVGSYQDLMKGTNPGGGGQRGQVIVPGDSVSSTLMRLVQGLADPSISMPHGKEPLSGENVTVLKSWIEQGAQNN